MRGAGGSGRTAVEAAQETGNLIASDKVQGTNVYNAAGTTLALFTTS
jgi:hypothetical protein